MGDVNAATATLGIAEASPVAYLSSVPRWVKAVDRAVIVLLNVALAIEVVLIFANTMARTLFNSSALMGVDETSSLFLITLAFLGGAVSYGRGQFIAITTLVDRAPRGWNAFFKAGAEWMVILISVLIGGYSIPLLLANAEEKSILLGISYVWMTLPITLGCLLFVIHAAFGLASRPRVAIVTSLATVAALVAVFMLFKHNLVVHPHVLYWGLAAMFSGLIALGVPVGFVLATVGIACVQAAGSADMMAVVMNAQRRSESVV